MVPRQTGASNLAGAGEGRSRCAPAARVEAGEARGYDGAVRRLPPLVFLAVLIAVGCGDDPLTTDDSVAADSASPAPETARAEPRLEEGIALLNAQRNAVGLSSVVLDDALTAGCLDHVRYMVAVGKVLHTEDPDDPNYTEAGAAAGPNANIAGDVADLPSAIEFWTASLYHRLTMLDPGVSKVGVAFESGYACLDVFTAFEAIPDHEPVQYPAHLQMGVPTEYAEHGPVSPLPADLPPPTGPIVSLMFAPERVIGPDFKMRLLEEDTGAQVDTFVRLPHDPADPYADFLLNTVAAIPLSPLEPSRTYRVISQGKVDGEVREKQWVFTTADQN